MESPTNFKSYLSVLIIIGTLLMLVFLQMEERRLGYALLHLKKEHRKLVEQRQRRELMLVRATRPQHVEKLAKSRRELHRIRPDQVIQLSRSER